MNEILYEEFKGETSEPVFLAQFIGKGSYFTSSFERHFASFQESNVQGAKLRTRRSCV
jgi:hypothetical protein